MNIHYSWPSTHAHTHAIRGWWLWGAWHSCKCIYHSISATMRAMQWQKRKCRFCQPKWVSLCECNVCVRVCRFVCECVCVYSRPDIKRQRCIFRPAQQTRIVVVCLCHFEIISFLYFFFAYSSQINWKLFNECACVCAGVHLKYQPAHIGHINACFTFEHAAVIRKF